MSNQNISASEKFAEDAKSAWAEVFPNSRCYVRNLLSSVYFSGYLAKDASECANRISENDPLYYSGWYMMDTADVFKEEGVSLLVKPPVGTHLVYGRAKMRCSSIKQPDRDKLVKRFMKLRDFIRNEKDNMKNLCFDINDKV